MSPKKTIEWSVLPGETLSSRRLRLDRVVAEEIMGWKEDQRCSYEPNDVVESDYCVYFCKRCGCTEREGDFERHKESDPPRYTQNLDDAWRVIRYTWRNINVITEGKECHTMLHILLEDTIGERWDGIVDAMTPENLCIAALRACGYEVHNDTH